MGHKIFVTSSPVITNDKCSSMPGMVSEYYTYCSCKKLDQEGGQELRIIETNDGHDLEIE